MIRRGVSRSVEKERFWRDVFHRHGESGLKVREFCRAEGLKESAFYFWKRTITERDREKRPGKAGRSKGGRPRKASASSMATFMPLAVVGEAARLEIVAPDGWQVRVPDGVSAQTLCDVVAALRQPSGQETT